jgi:hypothetical protein
MDSVSEGQLEVAVVEEEEAWHAEALLTRDEVDHCEVDDDLSE